MCSKASESPLGVIACLCRGHARVAVMTTADFDTAAAIPDPALCYQGDCEKMTGRARPCPIHDVPSARNVGAEHYLQGWLLELCNLRVVAIILEAVNAGATLVLTGPGSLVDPSYRGFGATLESETGARNANAEGKTLGPVLVEIAAKWSDQ